jgi:hypothetical protein
MLNKSKLKERKGEKTKHKRRQVAREERDKGNVVKIGYRKIQINGEWFNWDERGETEEKILEEEEKMRRRIGEKRYKEKVNKKVDERRKRKAEKKQKGKGKSRYRKSTKG